MELSIRNDEPQRILTFLSAIRRGFPEKTNEVMELTLGIKNGITVEITPLVFPRTRQQEKYYRKWCGEFAKFCGMIPDEMHEELLCRCFGSETVNTRMGWRRRPYKRSADTSTTDYGDLIETLIRTAAEMDFVVPPPVREARNDEEQENV